MTDSRINDFGGFATLNVTPEGPSNRNQKTVDELQLRARGFRQDYVSTRLSKLEHIVSGRVKRYFELRAAKAELHGMSSYELADMGITRGEITQVVDGEHYKEPSSKFVSLGAAVRKLFNGSGGSEAVVDMNKDPSSNADALAAATAPLNDNKQNSGHRHAV